jgi:uncharacterized protein (TIGR01777 family)
MMKDKRRIAIAGGTGFIGRAVFKHLLTRGYDVIVLTRSPRPREDGVREEYWDGQTLGPWAKLVDGAHGVINLAGKNVNCRYTPRARDEMNQSRMLAVRVMHEAVARCAAPPKVLVQASSLPIYGDAGDRVCDESAPPGIGYPVETCLLWEGEFNRVPPTAETRRVMFRIGFVLGPGGGVLRTLSRLTRCFLGGTVGNGRQYISWLHIDDLCEMFRWAIEREEMSGVYNACTPNPLPNAQFMRELRRALHRPWSPPTPPWMVKIGAWLICTEALLALTGRRCVPKRLMEMNFPFQFLDVRSALADIYRARATVRCLQPDCDAGPPGKTQSSLPPPGVTASRF